MDEYTSFCDAIENTNGTIENTMTSIRHMGNSVTAYDSNSSDGEVQKVSQLSNEMCSLMQDEKENLTMTCNQTQVKLDLSGGQMTEVCPWNESSEAKDMSKILDLSPD